MRWLQQNCVTRNVRTEAATGAMKSATNVQDQRVRSMKWDDLVYSGHRIYDFLSVYVIGKVYFTVLALTMYYKGHYSNRIEQLQRKFALESTGRLSYERIAT